MSIQALAERIDDWAMRRLGVPWILHRQCHSVVERENWVLSHIGHQATDLLDAGSGGGGAALAGAAGGHRVTAIELEPRASRIQRRYEALKHQLPGSIRVAVVDLRRLAEWADEQQYDHVILLEVIEHIVHDEKLVSDLSVRIKPGGRLYITTPNERYHGLLGDRIHETEDGDHVRWGYSEERLRNICLRAGLEVTEVTYLCGFIGQQLINLRLALLRYLRLNVNITLVLTYPLRALTTLDRFFTYEPLSIAIVAQRPTDLTATTKRIARN